MEKLETIEFEIAQQAKPQKDAFNFLTSLLNKKANLAILTRNSLDNAFLTLECSGLLDFFHPDYIIDRNSCKPKPDPDGVNKLITLWNASPKDTVIVGDYKFDLMAGRKAGVHAIYLDIPGDRKWAEHADLTVGSFAELQNYL